MQPRRGRKYPLGKRGSDGLGGGEHVSGRERVSGLGFGGGLDWGNLGRTRIRGELAGETLGSQPRPTDIIWPWQVL